MSYAKVISCILLILPVIACLDSMGQSYWPDSKKACVILTYDDAYDNHLDIVVPQLDKSGLKATFFVPVATGTLMKRKDEWKSVASKGYELGNHMIYHPCSWKSINMDIPEGHGDLARYTFFDYFHELDSANQILFSIDRQPDRTFAYTCGQYIIDGVDISDSLQKLCLAGRAAGDIPDVMDDFNIYKTPSWCVPEFTGGAELIKFAEQAKDKGTIAIFMFHNIGGKTGYGGFNVSQDDHLQLLQYLEKNRDLYYCTTFKEVMKYIREKQVLSQ